MNNKNSYVYSKLKMNNDIISLINNYLFCDFISDINNEYKLNLEAHLFGDSFIYKFYYLKKNYRFEINYRTNNVGKNNIFGPDLIHSRNYLESRIVGKLPEKYWYSSGKNKKHGYLN